VQAIRSAYLAAHNTQEKTALLLTLAVIRHPDAATLYDEILTAPVAPDLVDFDPHDRERVREISVLVHSVGGLAALVEDGIDSAVGPLLDAVNHALRAVRRHAVYRILRTGNAALIAEMRNRLLPGDQAFLSLRAAQPQDLQTSSPVEPPTNEPETGTSTQTGRDIAQ
jgi:HEAT repeat protein